MRASFDIAPRLTTITHPYGCTGMAGQHRVPASVCASTWWHAGVDLGWAGGDPNAPQHATRAGVVRHAGTIPGHVGLGDRAVCIEVDGSGELILYGHLEVAHVGVGQRVVPGQVVGVTGTRGWSTGNHAHIEVRRRGQLNGGVPGATLDPMPYLTSRAGAGDASMTDHELMAHFGMVYANAGVAHGDFTAAPWRPDILHENEKRVRLIRAGHGDAMGMTNDIWRVLVAENPPASRTMAEAMAALPPVEELPDVELPAPERVEPE